METSLEDKAQQLRTLGHSARLRIAVGLAGRCACVKEIQECLGLPQAVVSQHLKVMKAAGILTAHRQGNRVCYSLDGEMFIRLLRVMGVVPEEGAGVSDRRGRVPAAVVR
ncbi:MAG TPA: metalloregulator ArsR/SmtB family transcription factor [Geobacteraceae bacterium]